MKLTPGHPRYVTELIIDMEHEGQICLVAVYKIVMELIFYVTVFAGTDGVVA